VITWLTPTKCIQSCAAKWRCGQWWTAYTTVVPQDYILIPLCYNCLQYSVQ
jgi:hypothetical protein